ncbi:nSTAND1 domain-containing NTPase [[Scytonema hofmanni] UTEX B 1581]|uniref:nSTAND1 domain-containing NTPase n=1 Tax=[Scytonema hofmanni] UTEX B 1581 TaxID=379535 RepID=UPI0004967B4F|nr:caspase family protein [[Scytonema hofmanni] UTEX B 1581]
MCPIGVGTSRSNQVKKTDTGKLWLMFVGVNKYQDEGLPTLNYSSVDCQGLADALTGATRQFPQKEVKIHHDFASLSPSKENVRVSLQEITAAAKPQDMVLFYFSGHGMLEPNSQEAFLCLADTQKSNLQNTGLKLQELLQLLNNCPAQNQLVWLDACHSGGMTLRGTTREPLLNPTTQLVEILQRSAAKSKGFYALLSCDNNQQSWEFPELGHGVFSYYLMRGLNGEAADSKGIISADGLYRYVYHQTLQYIDKTNQQLRLINQQRRGKGDTQLEREYPLQTPKRIVEGVGELILGAREEKADDDMHRRLGIVVEGLSGSTVTLDISKFLGNVGGFNLEYLQGTKAAADDVRSAIARLLHSPESGTILLYLRGRIEETEAIDSLVLGEDIRIKRSWLKQQLRQCNAKQIIILDCPGSAAFLQDWVEDLQIDSQEGQCIIACASLASSPEKFAQTLFDTLKVAAEADGLSAAGAIAQLQLQLAGSDIPFYVWLSGTQGIIEILREKTYLQGREQKAGLDLGICPYMGLSAFSENDAQYFYGRESLTQQLIHQLRDRSFLAVVGASGSGKSSVVQAGVIPQLRLGKQIPSSEQWLIRTLRPGANPIEVLAQRLGGERRGQGGQGGWGGQGGQGGQGGLLEDKEEISISSLSSPSSLSPLSPSSPPSPPPHLFLEGVLHQGVESFVYWLRNRPEPMIVLVIDQFEELFTLASPTDRERFLELVLGAAEYAKDRFKLIITLRADFITSCLEVPRLAEVLQESSVLVPPRLSLDDYRQVIVSPAQQVGLKLEPELVEVLLRELNHSVGDLPLLEFVLEQLWQHRSTGKLTLQAYQEELGGIKGALERSSQALYESLDSQAKECAKWIFLSLTQLGEGTEDTRRRIHKSELIVKKYPAALVERTLQALTAAKLIVMNLEEEEEDGGRGGQGDKETRGQGDKETRGQGDKGTILSPHPPLPPSPCLPHSHLPLPPVTVEVAHEILIRHWSTLRWWLEENRSRLRSQRQIEQAAQLWLQTGQQSDFLLQGVRLAEAEDIYIKYTDELTADVQQFIEGCLEERKRQQFQEKRRLRQAQRAVVALSFLGIAASSFAGLAYFQTRTAQLREIEALNSSSQANFLSNQPLEALIASVKAGKQLKQIIGASKDVQFQTISSLGHALSNTQQLNRLEGHGKAVISVKFSPDGQTIASASDDETVKLWRRDGKLLRTLEGHEEAIKDVSFSPDGKMIATGSFDGKVKLWRTIDGGLIKTINAHDAEIYSVSWSADGQMIGSGSADKTVKIWRVSDGQFIRTLSGHNDDVNSISFSLDSQIIASGSADKTIKIWRVSDGTLLKTLTGHTAAVNSVAFSPEGKIASGSADKTIKIWRITDATLPKTIEAHSDQVTSVSFSPDGQTLASASKDKTINLWNPKDGTLLQTFLGHTIEVNGVSFSPDAQTLASAGADQTVILWRRDNSLIKTLTGHNSWVNSVSFSPQGNLLASVSDDKSIKLWHIPNMTLRSSLEGLDKSPDGHNGGVYGVSFSPDGQTMATSGGDRWVILWRTSDGYMIKPLEGHNHEVNNVSFSPKGDILASASADATIKLWRVKDGKLIRTLTGHKGEVFRVRFSPKGGILASAGRDNTVKIWRVSDGQLVRIFKGHTKAVSGVSFNPKGDVLASASSDKTIKLWRVSDGKLLKTLRGHTEEVWGVTFSPDGSMIASASNDNTVKLWSKDGIEMKTFWGHSQPVIDVSFSPEGKMIASASNDGTVKLWRVDSKQLQTTDLDHLLVRSCRWLHNYLENNPKINNQKGNLCSDLKQ